MKKHDKTCEAKCNWKYAGVLLVILALLLTLTSAYRSSQGLTPIDQVTYGAGAEVQN